VDFRPVAPATVWVPSCSRLILIATGFAVVVFKGDRP
jgi:hypothetical protein